MDHSIVIHSVSKSEILAAKNIASRATLLSWIRNSGKVMPEWYWTERVFVGEKVLELERIFNESLSITPPKAATNNAPSRFLGLLRDNLRFS